MIIYFLARDYKQGSFVFVFQTITLEHYLLFVVSNNYLEEYTKIYKKIYKVLYETTQKEKKRSIVTNKLGNFSGGQSAYFTLSVRETR